MILTAFLMSLSLIFCIIYQEKLINYLSFIIPIALLLLIGYLFNIRKAKSKRLLAREGLVIAGTTWLIIAFFGCMPFMISKEIPNFFDAFFEMVSGFTTTGASILTGEEMEALSHSLKFWRSFSHWIGGMGVLVFILAIIPESKEGSAVHILRAESPGPQVGRLVSKMQATSRILYLIYLVLTIIQFLFLWIGPDKKMNFFNSLIYTLGTAGTGGFSIHAAGVGYFSIYSQYVIAIFMIIFGINFSLFYLVLIGNVKEAFKNEELRWYLTIVTISVLIVCFTIYNIYDNVEETFRHSLFQVATIISTSGYSTVDFEQWPTIAKCVLLFLMITGGCAGSTAGGIKVARIGLLTKSSISKVKNTVNPRQVTTTTFDGKAVNENMVDNIQTYFVVYCMVFVVCTFLISVDGFDLITNITSSLTCLNNVGPGLGNIVGPAGSFGDFSNFSKFILSIEMIAGRLELFPLLVLFSPKTWKRKI